MVRCKNCIIPDSFPGISYVDGLCSFCRESNDSDSHRQSSLRGKEKLREVLKSKESGKYDCLVPTSGGKDSSFILLYVVEELGLRPLALFVNNGFQSDLSIKNVINMCRQLRVDLIIADPTRYREKAVFEALVCEKVKNYGGICGYCETVLRRTATKIAGDHGIHIIVWGSTDYEDTVTKYYPGWNDKTFKMEYGSRKPFRDAFSRYVDVAGKVVAVRGTLLHLFRFWVYSSLMKFELRIGGISYWLNPFAEFSFAQNKIQTAYFYDYVPYDPLKHVEVLKQELGWETAINQDTRFDCRLACFPNYEFLRETGITKVGFIKATLVRKGLIDRENALENELSGRENLRKICEETLKDLEKKRLNPMK
jgi:glucosamine--fructose-6-phosphate aminotransferase (isomerizing)